MFGSSGPHDLGYTANAVLIALIRQLLSNGTITQDQFADLIEDAANILRPSSHVGSIGAAIKNLDDVKRRVAA